MHMDTLQNRKGRRAQASFEYLAVFAIALVILIPMIYIFQSYTIQSADAIQHSKIATIGEDLVNTAEAVYYMGYPARLTIQEDFPTGISGMELTANWSQGANIISFHTSGGTDMSYFCGVNINATLPSNVYSPGLKNIMFETRNSTQGNYVWIEFK